MVCAAHAGAGRPRAGPREGVMDVDGGDSEVRRPLRGQTETAVGSYFTWRGAGADDVGGVGAEAERPSRSRPSRARESGAEGMERKEPLLCGCCFTLGGESGVSHHTRDLWSPPRLLRPSQVGL